MKEGLLYQKLPRGKVRCGVCQRRCLMNEGLLYQKLPRGKVRCGVCQRRCLMNEGQWGYCQTRVNKAGKLYTSIYGVVSSLNLDPIEKKPVFHFKPGSECLSFGTYGCNFRCIFCFTPDTNIVTENGIYTLEELYDKNLKLKVITHLGKLQKIRKVFKHRYKGQIINIKASYTPPIKCTPSHKFFATTTPSSEKIIKIKASELTSSHYLIIPKNYPFSENVTFDIKQLLTPLSGQFKKSRKTSFEDVLKIMSLSQNVAISKKIGEIFNLHPAYVRTLRSKLRLSNFNKQTIEFEKNSILEKKSLIKFKTEKLPFIPRFLNLNEDLARLLGFYCAEGWVGKSKNRPSSYRLILSFGKREIDYVQEVKDLIIKTFNVKPKIIKRRTTTTVEIGKSSIALFFKLLCGSGANKKQVPSALNRAAKNIVESFLEGYVKGDGRQNSREIVINTTSQKLALGIYWLVLKLGFLPRFYTWQPPKIKKIEKRQVNQANLYYVKWRIKKAITVREKAAIKFKEDDKYYFLPINKVDHQDYEGPVYNLEVESDHSYLANFTAVGNCQNWQIAHFNGASLNLEGEKLLSPQEVVKLAIKSQADGIALTYNEPAIWLEYSLAVFKLAKKENLYTVWVTNGYATKEALDLIAPFLDVYRVDLKSFENKFYQKLIKIPKASVVFTTTKYLHQKYPQIHIECVTNIIPTWNDNPKTLTSIAQWIKKNLGNTTPWHVTRFYPDAELNDVPPTPPQTLLKAREIGLKAGLSFVYIGNMSVEEEDDTFCPKCGNLAVRRTGYKTEVLGVDKEGNCTDCGENLNIKT